MVLVLAVGEYRLLPYLLPAVATSGDLLMAAAIYLLERRGRGIISILVAFSLAVVPILVKNERSITLQSRVGTSLIRKPVGGNTKGAEASKLVLHLRINKATAASNHQWNVRSRAGEVRRCNGTTFRSWYDYNLQKLVRLQ